MHEGRKKKTHLYITLHLDNMANSVHEFLRWHFFNVAVQLLSLNNYN